MCSKNSGSDSSLVLLSESVSASLLGCCSSFFCVSAITNIYLCVGSGLSCSILTYRLQLLIVATDRNKKVNWGWWAFREGSLHPWNAACELKSVVKFAVICSDLICSTLHCYFITETPSHMPLGGEPQEAGPHSLPTETVAGGVKKQNERMNKHLKTFMLLHQEIAIFCSNSSHVVLWWLILGNNLLWLWRD